MTKALKAKYERASAYVAAERKTTQAELIELKAQEVAAAIEWFEVLRKHDAFEGGEEQRWTVLELQIKTIRKYQEALKALREAR